MFLTTSATLASKAGALTSIIEEIDRVLVAGREPSITIDILATKTGKSDAQTEAALELFVKAGTLKALVCVRCKNDDCAQLVELAGKSLPKECTACDSSRFHSDRVKVYRLTPAGRDEQLRATAGLGSATMPSRLADYKGKVDAVVMAMRPSEFAAVLKRFPDEKSLTGRRRYNFTRIWSPAAKRRFLVATLKLPDQGPGEAQAATRDTIDDLDPRVILLVGIAGGAPGEVALGDVVFGNYVHDLTVQASESDGSRTFSAKGGPMHESVRRLLANLQVDLKPFLTNLGLPALPPLEYSAKVAGDEKTAAKVLALLKARYGDPPAAPAHPEFIDAPIASSGERVQDPELVQLWRTVLRHIAAIEMELAGVYRGARNANGEHPVVSIRAISDIVGLSRDPAWTAYAEETAAAYALAFVQSWTGTPGKFS